MPRPRKYPIRWCELASCRGGLNGCDMSTCKKAKWDNVTAEEAVDLYGIDVHREKPFQRNDN